MIAVAQSTAPAGLILNTTMRGLVEVLVNVWAPTVTVLSKSATTTASPLRSMATSVMETSASPANTSLHTVSLHAVPSQSSSPRALQISGEGSTWPTHPLHAVPSGEHVIVPPVQTPTPSVPLGPS